MKPQHFAALAGALLVMALLLLFAGRPDPKPRTAETPHLVTVMGESTLKVRPDQATLTFTVSTWTQGASAAEAEALNVASVNRVIAALMSAGVEQEEIEAGYPAILPLTRQDYAGKTYLTGFEASRKVVATLRATARTEAAISAALSHGATSLVGVVYSLEDNETSRQRVVQAAIANARVRADAIARAEGRTLGPMVAVEVLDEESPRTAASPGGLIYRARVRATFQH